MTDAATDQGNGNIVEDDCPLCLEPLPPFWDLQRLIRFYCCGKAACLDCRDKRKAYLDRAVAEGSVGRQEEQLDRCCPLCRAEIPRDVVDSTRMMQERFENGHLPLILYHRLALDFISPPRIGDELERGVEILMLGANKGDPICQDLIAGRYDRGSDGSPKSPEEAKRWYLAAAEQGHAIAEYCLAGVLEDEGDNTESIRHLKGSADKGYDLACYSLGKAHYEGKRGVRKSSDEAIRVLTPAAERGDARSMSLLGFILCSPDPWVPQTVDPNYTKGSHWLRRAAEKGDQHAISDLRELEERDSSFCFRCHTKAPPEKAFLRCSRCRAAWYCSKDCQRRHWKATEGGHKKCCIKWK